MYTRHMIGHIRTRMHLMQILGASMCALLATAALAHAQNNEALGDFKALSSGFGDIVKATGTDLNTASFGTFINGIYKLVIRIAGALAVAMFVWGGILYMVAPFGVAGEGLSKAKERMQNAVIGLLMLLATWVIFNQINPDILNLTINQKPLAPTSPSDAATQETQNIQNNTGSPQETVGGECAIYNDLGVCAN